MDLFEFVMVVVGFDKLINVVVIVLGDLWNLGINMDIFGDLILLKFGLVFDLDIWFVSVVFVFLDKEK